MRTVCLIPARGGSVRIPHKNRRVFHGKPIIQYSIENARKSGLFDSVVVSTDDFDIMNLAADLGASTYLRDYDDGTKGTQEVAADFLNSFDGRNYGMCCVLYATCPLLTWRDLVDGYRVLLESPKIHGAHLYAMTMEEAPGWQSVNGYPIWPKPTKDIGGFYFGFAQAFRDGVPLEENSAAVEIDVARCCDLNTFADIETLEQKWEALYGN